MFFFSLFFILASQLNSDLLKSDPDLSNEIPGRIFAHGFWYLVRRDRCRLHFYKLPQLHLFRINDEASIFAERFLKDRYEVSGSLGDDVGRSTSLWCLKKKGPQKVFRRFAIGRLEDYIPPNIYIYLCVSNAFMSTWFETQILGISTHHQSLRTSMNQLHPPRPSQWEQLEALLHSKGGDLSRSFC